MLAISDSSLKERYGKDMNIKKWSDDPNNLLICNINRIFINVNGERRLFYPPKSKWKNPYKVGVDGTLDEVVVKYKTMFQSYDFEELRGITLGCLCIDKCQGSVLYKAATYKLKK